MTVTDVAKEDGSQGAEEESDGISSEGVEHPEDGIGVREEQGTEDNGSGRGVDIKVVELNGRPHERGHPGAYRLLVGELLPGVR